MWCRAQGGTKRPPRRPPPRHIGGHRSRGLCTEHAWVCTEHAWVMRALVEMHGCARGTDVRRGTAESEGGRRLGLCK